MEPLITGKNVSKSFILGEVSIQALKDITFQINQGELVVVLGPSGSGKSTFLNILGGIDDVSSGEIYYKNIPLHLANQKEMTNYRRAYVGFVFQFYNLMPNLTALENIEISAEMNLNSLDAAELLQQVGLGDRADHYPGKMSGGQQQRVAIARALCKNPDLLLCDEPTGALDVSTGAQILSLLVDFQKKYNKTVIIITHNQEVAKIANRVFHFKDGALIKVQRNDNPLLPEEVDW